MWYPFRLGTWCFVLEENGGSQWECMVCEKAAYAVDKYKETLGSCGRPPVPEVDLDDMFPERRWPFVH
jgi:hypothetical protein